MKRKIFILGILVVGICSNIFAANTVNIYKSNAVASYYGDKFHGRKTSSGETFDMYGFTAAHKTLPFGTMVKVTNLANGKSVVVRVNDRGPFVAGREIDVSKAAATQLDMLTAGTAHVSLEIIDNNKEVEAVPVEATTPSAEEKLVNEENSVATTDSAVEQRWDIQLAAFSSRSNAEAFAQKVQKAGIKNLAYQRTKDITRVIIRDISTEQISAHIELLESKGFTEYLVKERKN